MFKFGDPGKAIRSCLLRHVCGGSTAGHVGGSTSRETLAPHFTVRPSNSRPAGWDSGSSLPKCRIRCHPNEIGGILRHNLAKEKLNGQGYKPFCNETGKERWGRRDKDPRRRGPRFGSGRPAKAG